MEIILYKLIFTTAHSKLWTTSDTNTISKLKQDFIITYIDKAPANFVFVCKKFYILTLIKEFSTNTYERSTDTMKTITKTHNMFLTSWFANKTKSFSNKLPYAYASIKIVKQPLEFRHIAGSANCSMKPLSTLLNEILQTFKPLLLKLWTERLSIPGFTSPPLWMIKSSLDITNRLKHINGHMDEEEISNETRMIQTFDVKTLYTRLPHTDLIDKISELLNDIASLNKSNPIAIGKKFNKFYITYGNSIDNKNRYEQVYNISDITDILKYLVNNTYIKVANNIYKQVIGIPMGTNAGVNIADFYVVKYEFNFMLQLKLKNLFYCIIMFSRIMRYLDDIAAADNIYFSKLLCTTRFKQLYQ